MKKCNRPLWVMNSPGGAVAQAIAFAVTSIQLNSQESRQ